MEGNPTVSTSQNQEILRQILETTRKEFIEGVMSEFYSCTVSVERDSERANAFYRMGEFSIFISERLPSSLRKCPVCGRIEKDPSGQTFLICYHKGTEYENKTPPAKTEWVDWDPILTDEGILKMLGTISESMNANLVTGNYKDIDLAKIALKISANTFAEVFILGEDRYVRRRDRVPTREEFTRWILGFAMNIYSVISKGDKMKLLENMLKATERKEEIKILPEEEQKRKPLFGFP